MRRRDLLKAGAAAGAVGLAGCPALSNAMEIDVYQTESLAAISSVGGESETHAGDVAQSFIETAVAPIAEASDEWTHPRVNVVPEPIDLTYDSTQIIIRTIEWDAMIDERGGASEANVLLDFASPLRSNTVGVAPLTGGRGAYGCDPSDEDSNSSIVQYAQELLKFEPDLTPRRDFEVVDAEGNVGEYLPYFVGSAAAHEAGHNACGLHSHGNAYRDDVPTRLTEDDEPSTDTVYASLMMHFYVLYYGGFANRCGREIAEVDHEYDDDGEIQFNDALRLSTRFSDCAIARAAEFSSD